MLHLLERNFLHAYVPLEQEGFIYFQFDDFSILDIEQRLHLTTKRRSSLSLTLNLFLIIRKMQSKNNTY